jgi:hypothetical protein
VLKRAGCEKIYEEREVGSREELNMAKKRTSDRASRRSLIEEHWDEIEKIAIGLQSGQLEAFEMYGMVLDDLIGNAAQADMYMAVLFEVLPPEAQRKMLADRRLGQSRTVLPMLKLLRAKTKRPRRDRG